MRLSASEPTIYANRLLQGAFDVAFHETWGMPYEPLSELYSMRVPGHGSYAALLGLSSKAAIEELILRLISLPPKTKAFLDTLNEVVVLYRLLIKETKQSLIKRLRVSIWECLVMKCHFGKCMSEGLRRIYEATYFL